MAQIVFQAMAWPPCFFWFKVFRFFWYWCYYLHTSRDSVFFCMRDLWPSYANLLFKNVTILTTITTTTNMPTRKTTTATSRTIVAEKPSPLFVPVVYNGEGISASSRAIELFLGSNWGRILFPIHWCTLQVWLPHQGPTLTVERSTLSASVTKLAFSA